MTLVRVGTSPIDRQGLFAATDIPQGTRIIAYLGEKITKSDSARRLANHCGAKNCCGYILGREYWGCIPVQLVGEHEESGE